MALEEVLSAVCQELGCGENLILAKGKYYLALYPGKCWLETVGWWCIGKKEGFRILDFRLPILDWKRQEILDLRFTIEKPYSLLSDMVQHERERIER